MFDWITLKRGIGRKISGFGVRIPLRFYKYFRPDYEKANFDFMKRHVHPGNIVLDVGAHIGLFSIAAAKLVGATGRVYCFEPTGQTFKILKQTISINRQQNITPIKAAVGSYSGKIQFFTSMLPGDNSNSIVSYKTDRELSGSKVDIVSVDDFMKEYKLGSVHFLKIDVEGAEFEVLQGAVSTLNKMHPVIILAIHPEAIKAKGDSLGDIYDLIEITGYTINARGKAISKESFCNTTALIDLHLLPAEKL